MSNDHTVPRMYLRRFAEERRGEWFVRARRVDDLERHFPPNIRKVAAVSDFYGERVEKFLCMIEKGATPVFDALLDAREGALPAYWPVDNEDRAALAWWIAAQIVRTTRQRHRLVHLAGDSHGDLALPKALRSKAGRDKHVKFIAEHLAKLAFIVFNRPWGLGFSTLCLLTSDSPVVVINGHDDPNQLLAAAFWDVVLPLDPHRFLILPGRPMRRRGRAKQRDHLALLPGGLSLALNSIIFEAADNQIFCHPDHDPLPHLRLEGPRLPTPWRDDDPPSRPEWVFDYGVVAFGHTIERRWLEEHPWQQGPDASAS
ncbi:Protein of unknown function [Amycolatopsis pretoriensis]|uniref:DUF4238 domain-containing protein n=1 Tax=Amycolatopsis pretoriensis TaxID=218821 RepID=A0A1H5QNG7_9PSEU|nr:DUF4238 domain-containing protein [Amycolatopsis pretoriensis]SEF27384.1 Protein of unknown function [Amycolatopsis pretoriensis]